MNNRPAKAKETTDQQTSVSNEFSDQLRKTSLVSILMIVGIHSFNIVYLNKNETTVSDIVLWIQTWLSDWVFRIGTPTFMAISGFMFFWSFSMNLKDYRSKVTKRLRNLAVPFLIWSSLGIGLFLTLQTFPLTQIFFKEPYLHQKTWKELLRILVIDPIPYQLWFLRDLVIMSLLSPLVYFILSSRFSFLALCSGFAIWFFNLPELGVNNKTTFFYVLGAWGAIQKRKGWLANYKSWLKCRMTLIISFASWIILSFLGSVISVREEYVVEPLYKLQILFGMNVLWFGYPHWLRFFNFGWVDHLKTLTFFIYASHEPFTRIICKALLKLIPAHSMMVLLVYFVTIGIVISVCSFAGLLLKKRLPYIYGLLSGWR